MRAYCLDISFQGGTYRFDKVRGCLSVGDFEADSGIPADCSKYLDMVNRPFLLQGTKAPELLHVSGMRHKRLAGFYARVLSFLCRHCYPLAYLCSRYVTLDLFDNAEQAVLFFRHMYPDTKRQNRLCLPRAIFAATTSSEFRRSGALFVGAFLPSTQMHAWVIENCRQPDFYDNMWVCYQPVYILTRI